MSTIAVVGGTGQLGRAIARRLAKAGHGVVIGSRSAEAAQAAAAEIGFGAWGCGNSDAAQGTDFVFVAVPYAAQSGTLREIRDAVGDAIVIDTTVPLVPPKVMRVQLPAAGCAALEARAQLGEEIRLATALHNVAAHKLITDEDVDCDVFVFSDDLEARTRVIGLVGEMGLRGLSGGGLANSAAAEALTSVLIHLNKTYSASGAGVRITGLPHAPEH